jgi:hypothetical protein
VRAVPEISRFLGIVVSMYYDEHAPPHFHARRGEYKLIVEIETLATTGQFPVEAANAVRHGHVHTRGSCVRTGA